MSEVLFYAIVVFLGAWLPPICLKLLRNKPRAITIVSFLILIIYLYANLSETILFRTVSDTRHAAWIPFWSYRQALALETAPGGIVDVVLSLIRSPRDTIAITDPDLLAEIFLNILLYVPLGYLLPFVWPKMKRFGKLLAWRVILIGFLMSCLTEVSQLVFKIGLFEFDDIINNTVGCLIGCSVYGLMEKSGAIAERVPQEMRN